MINYIVFDPTKRFLEHLKKSGYKYRYFPKDTRAADCLVKIHDYKFGTYDGMTGHSAMRKINGKWE